MRVNPSLTTRLRIGFAVLFVLLGIVSLLGVGRERGGVHGLLVRCGDHEAAAAQIARLLREPDLTQALVTRAREVCERYRWTLVREQWLSVYRSLAQPSALPAPTTV